MTKRVNSVTTAKGSFNFGFERSYVEFNGGRHYSIEEVNSARDCK